MTHLYPKIKCAPTSLALTLLAWVPRITFSYGKKSAVSLHPTTGALLCINYLRKGEWPRCNHLCLLTHPGCSNTPHK